MVMNETALIDDCHSATSEDEDEKWCFTKNVLKRDEALIGVNVERYLPAFMYSMFSFLNAGSDLDLDNIYPVDLPAINRGFTPDFSFKQVSMKNDSQVPFLETLKYVYDTDRAQVLSLWRTTALNERREKEFLNVISSEVRTALEEGVTGTYASMGPQLVSIIRERDKTTGDLNTEQKEEIYYMLAEYARSWILSQIDKTLENPATYEKQRLRWKTKQNINYVDAFTDFFESSLHMRKLFESDLTLTDLVCDADWFEWAWTLVTPLTLAKFFDCMRNFLLSKKMNTDFEQIRLLATNYRWVSTHRVNIVSSEKRRVSLSSEELPWRTWRDMCCTLSTAEFRELEEGLRDLPYRSLKREILGSTLSSGSNLFETEWKSSQQSLVIQEKEQAKTNVRLHADYEDRMDTRLRKIEHILIHLELKNNASHIPNLPKCLPYIRRATCPSEEFWKRYTVMNDLYRLSTLFHWNFIQNVDGQIYVSALQQMREKLGHLDALYFKALKENLSTTPDANSLFVKNALLNSDQIKKHLNFVTEHSFNGKEWVSITNRRDSELNFETFISELESIDVNYTLFFTWRLGSLSSITSAFWRKEDSERSIDPAYTKEELEYMSPFIYEHVDEWLSSVFDSYFSKFRNFRNIWKGQGEQHIFSALFLNDLCRSAMDIQLSILLPASVSSEQSISMLNTYDVWNDYLPHIPKQSLSSISETKYGTHKAWENRFVFLRDLRAYLQGRQLYWSFSNALTSSKKRFEFFNNKGVNISSDMLNISMFYTLQQSEGSARQEIIVGTFALLNEKYGLFERRTTAVDDDLQLSYTAVISLLNKIPPNILQAFGRFLVPIVFNMTFEQIEFTSTEVIDLCCIGSIAYAACAYAQQEYDVHNMRKVAFSFPMFAYTAYSISSLLPHIFQDYGSLGLTTLNTVFKIMFNRVAPETSQI